MKRISAGTLSFFADILSVVLIALLLSAATFWFIQRPVFLLRHVDVVIEGNKEAVSVEEVAQALKGNLHGNYFTASLGSAAASLKDIPWVKDVAIVREWPNSLQIELVLHEPIAIWGDGKLLAKDGTIFVANPDVADPNGQLPRINGPEQKRMRIYDQYRRFEAVCEQYGYHVVSLDLEDFGGWIVRFKRPDGKTLKLTLKEGDSPEALDEKLKEVILNLPRLKDRLGGEPLEMDARYAKGVAVVKPAVEQETDEDMEHLPGVSKDGR